MRHRDKRLPLAAEEGICLRGEYTVRETSRKKWMTAACLMLLLTLLPATGLAEDELRIQESWSLALIQGGSLEGIETIPSASEAMLLTESGQEDTWRDAIYQGLLSRSPQITVTDTAAAVTQENLNAFVNTIKEMYETVVNDHPELFYVSGNAALDGYGSTQTGLAVTIAPEYFPCDDAMIAAFQQKLVEAAAYADSFPSDWEKALAAHDYLMTACSYNWEFDTGTGTPGKQVYSAYGALVDGDAVCQGYALAYKLILSQMGIPCITVSSSTMKHMWNLVQLDGVWYHVDVTWDDPTPNVEGGGRHANFLRSDTGITEQGHSGWDSQGIVCQQEWEDDWWLNSVWFPIHYWQGSYYYVKIGSAPYVYQVYRTEGLMEEGVPVGSGNLANQFSSQYGVVWLEGQLYYTRQGTGDTRELMRCRLSDGRTGSVGTFTFTAEGNAGYQADNDGVGLRYDETSQRIVTYSNTRPMLLMPSFVPQDYPFEWDEASEDVVSLLGSYQRGDEFWVGLIWPEEQGDTKALLLAAFYENGRQTALMQVNTDSFTAGLNILPLPHSAAAYTEVKFFLLVEGTMVPLCGNLVSE